MTDLAADNPDQPKPLHQRVADRWSGLNAAGKAAVIGSAVIAVVGGLVIIAAAAGTSGPDSDDNEEDGTDSHPRIPDRRPTNASYGYNQCTHGVCSKKVDRRIIGHDCCGRCQTSRDQDCWETARRNYGGPGSFAHDFFGTLLYPNVCFVCDKPSEGHWVLDGGQSRTR